MKAELLEIVRKELAVRQNAKPNYSLRSFSRFLGLSPATLSGLLSGHRELTPKIALRILAHLPLATGQRQRLMEGFIAQAGRGATAAAADEADSLVETLAINRAQLPAARAMLRRFQSELKTFLSEGADAGATYCLSFNLYPLGGDNLNAVAE